MNRLANESSLYLQQHADNPVDWYPWGEEALNRAQKEDKPLLVSIGYSACHWCHVMAHESFEDSYIARLMNQHFVCIKVDREERPDLDHIYMEAVQMMSGQGGWPLNVFCLPDGRPFAGGTYFPPDERRGGSMIPWPQLIMRVADYFKRNRADLEENAEAIGKNLQIGNQPFDPRGAPVQAQAMIQTADQLIEAHDDDYGGFGTAPKFPPSMTLGFLLSLRGSAALDEHDPDRADRVDPVINRTLTAMAHGGIYDQIGGGFARYSVDQHWIIPHFEKMLYDNALLIDIYSRAWRRYPKPLYPAVVEESVDWLQRDMAGPDGGFISAIDADSEGEEGRFYVWTPAQVKEILGEKRGSEFCDAYGITDEGNFENGASQPVLLTTKFEEREAFRKEREALRREREKRVPPGRDPKRLLAWNALTVRALAEAAFTFGRTDWMQLAWETADWLWNTFRRDNDRLFSVYADGKAKLNGYLDDYAFFAEALTVLAGRIDWWREGLSSRCLERAQALVEVVTRHFADADAPGFFFTSDDHEHLVHRKKQWFDNATPAGNSSMLHALAVLDAVEPESGFVSHLEKMKVAYPEILKRAPSAVSHALAAFVDQAIGIAVIKAGPDADLDALREALISTPWRQFFVQRVGADSEIRGYQLCVGTICQRPVEDPRQLVDWL